MAAGHSPERTINVQEKPWGVLNGRVRERRANAGREDDALESKNDTGDEGKLHWGGKVAALRR